MADRKDWKKRRKRQLKRRIIRFIILFVMAVVLGSAVFGIVSIFQKLFGKDTGKDKKKEPNQTTVSAEKPKEKKVELVSNIPQEYTRAEAVEKIKEMAEKVPAMSKIAEREQEYPEELLTMLANNPETVEFVGNYLEKKNIGCTSETIDKIKEGKIPLLLQWDQRWGYAFYGDNCIAVSGCGPTALAMVAAGLKQDTKITPYAVAKYAEEKGYSGEAGTSWELMTEGAREFGISGQVLRLGENIIKEKLQEGNPIICSVKEGDFTTEGHYIVLVGLENGKIKLNDPNSITRSEKLWDYAELEPQIKNLWWYSIN